MVQVEGFILIGGASSRMGTDKARLVLDGQQFVERLAGALSHVTKRISLVGAKDTSEVWHFPVVPDIYPKWGALGGVHAALASCNSDWAAIVACDLPFVTGDLLVRLASLGEDFDSVVPVQDDGRQQPLCALYRRAACLGVVQELIAGGERRPRALLERIRTRWVSTNELSDLTGAQHFFVNVNTRDDYEQAKNKLGIDE